MAKTIRQKKQNLMRKGMKRASNRLTRQIARLQLTFEQWDNAQDFARINLTVEKEG